LFFLSSTKLVSQSKSCGCLSETTLVTMKTYFENVAKEILPLFASFQYSFTDSKITVVVLIATVAVGLKASNSIRLTMIYLSTAGSKQ